MYDKKKKTLLGYDIKENGNELFHYGIKGQKWGKRNYQNEDGTYTEAGKKRYFGSGLKKASKIILKNAKIGAAAGAAAGAVGLTTYGLIKLHDRIDKKSFTNKKKKSNGLDIEFDPKTNTITKGGDILKSSPYFKEIQKHYKWKIK